MDFWEVVEGAVSKMLIGVVAEEPFGRGIADSASNTAVVLMPVHGMLIVRDIDAMLTFVGTLLAVSGDGNHWEDCQHVGCNHNQVVVEVEVVVENDIVQLLEYFESC